MSLDSTSSTLTKTGKVTIENGTVLVEGFEGIGCSCRDIAVLACLEAIGVLQREVVKTVERPGGGAIAVD